MVICDVDGSLTNGTIYVNQTEEFARGFSVVDGYGIAQTQRTGIKIAFLSGKQNNSALVRALSLGIPEHLFLQGIDNKVEAFATLLASTGLKPANTIMWGDDVLDAQVKQVNDTCLFVCPCDAPFYIQACADLVIPRDGGRHALRLLLDLILFINKKHHMQCIIEKSLNEQGA